jgi:hypothetical protein
MYLGLQRDVFPEVTSADLQSGGGQARAPSPAFEGVPLQVTPK